MGGEGECVYELQSDFSFFIVSLFSCFIWNIFMHFLSISTIDLVKYEKKLR